MSGEPVAVLRVSRRRRWTERFARYKITVDGVVVARVRNGETVDAPISSGSHLVRASTLWTGSPEIAVDVTPGQLLELAASINTMGGDYSRTRHLNLRHVVRPSTGPCTARLESYGKKWTSVVAAARREGWSAETKEMLRPTFPVVIAEGVDEVFAKHVCAEVRDAGGEASYSTT